MMKSLVSMLSQRRSRLTRRRRRRPMAFTKSNSSETTQDSSQSNNSMDTSTTDEVVPTWKAENFTFKHGTFQESDWWESDSQTAEEGMELSFSVEFNDDTEEDAPSRDSSFLLSSSLSSSEQPHDPPAIHHRHCKHFRNRGYETWIAARQAWIDLGRENETNCPSSSSSSSRPPFPDKFKKELVKCLADRRQFELSNPIPLSEIIHAYNQAWNIESDDNE